MLDWKCLRPECQTYNKNHRVLTQSTSNWCEGDRKSRRLLRGVSRHMWPCMCDWCCQEIERRWLESEDEVKYCRGNGGKGGERGGMFFTPPTSSDHSSLKTGEATTWTATATQTRITFFQKKTMKGWRKEAGCFANEGPGKRGGGGLEHGLGGSWAVFCMPLREEKPSGLWSEWRTEGKMECWWHLYMSEQLQNQEVGCCGRWGMVIFLLPSHLFSACEEEGPTRGQKKNTPWKFWKQLFCQPSPSAQALL